MLRRQVQVSSLWPGRYSLKLNRLPSAFRRSPEALTIRKASISDFSRASSPRMSMPGKKRAQTMQSFNTSMLDTDSTFKVEIVDDNRER